MSDRLILLDIPGVLYSASSTTRLGGTPDSGTLKDVRFFDPVALGFIRRLFGLAGARVVVSDHWRRGIPAAILQQLDLQVEDMMPPAPGGFGAEIAAYFAKRPAPSAYVILSAAPGTMLPQQLAHLVSVDPAQGLTPDGFRRALDVLGVGCPSGMCLDVQPHPELAARLRQLQQLARLAPERFGPAAPAAAPAVLFHS